MLLRSVLEALLAAAPYRAITKGKSGILYFILRSFQSPFFGSINISTRPFARYQPRVVVEPRNEE